jgi:hypothetical protein
MADCKISEETMRRIAAAWQDMLGRIADGDQIRRVIEDAGFSTGMVRAYRAAVPSADAEWQRAKEESADAYSDEVAAIANNPGPDAALARVRADILKWLASKRNPRVYSDKHTLDVNVKTLDLTRIIQDANARLAGRRPVILEHAPSAPALAHDASAAIEAQAAKLLELL